MTDEDMADAFRDLFQTLHARIDSMPEGPNKAKAQRFVALMHGAANCLEALAGETGVIAMDGTNKPGP